MEYEEFKKKYNFFLDKMLSYTIDQAGSIFYAEKLGALSDAYPEFEERVDNENMNAAH